MFLFSTFQQQQFHELVLSVSSSCLIFLINLRQCTCIDLVLYMLVFLVYFLILFYLLYICQLQLCIRITIEKKKQFCIAFTFSQHCSPYCYRFCIFFFAFYLQFSIFVLVFLPHLRIGNLYLLYFLQMFLDVLCFIFKFEF